MNSPRIAVAGNQWITKYLVEALVKDGRTPSLLINNAPDSAKNISGYVDLAELAAEHGIEVHRPKKYSLRTEEDAEALRARPIDVLFVFGWQRLIPDWLIDHARCGAYGVHGGPEKPPRCRGRAVFNWALLMGCDRFYMYLFQLTPEVDDGDVLDLVEFKITPHDDVLTLYHKNCVISTRMFLRQLPRILAGEATAAPQSDGEPTYLPKRTPAQGGIAWNQPARRIENLVRAVAPPYPGAFTYLGDRECRIDQAHVFDPTIRYDDPPGTIVDAFPNGHFVVTTADEPLYVRSYSMEGGGPIVAGRRFQECSGEQPPDPVF